MITIIVKPVLRDGTTRGYFLVLFAEEHAPQDAPGAPLATRRESESEQLQEELTRIKSDLRSALEDAETQVEEAKAANEELQAMNEELRSSAEELETSKEELQSTNEELATVNQELKIKIEELALSNNDFRNLINSTDIGAVFLDRSLHVKLSTPRAREVFNLLGSDAGRLLSDITHRLAYPALHEDVRHVMLDLQTIEREVPSTDGRWFLVRIVPYRTSDDRIEGIALTFQDTTTRRQAEARVRSSEERLRAVFDSALDYAIFTVDNEGRIDSWNPGAERMFGYRPDEIIGARRGRCSSPRRIGHRRFQSRSWPRRARKGEPSTSGGTCAATVIPSLLQRRHHAHRRGGCARLYENRARPDDAAAGRNRPSARPRRARRSGH